jgi:hypothetical protein
MIRVTINLPHKIGHDPQFRIIATQVDVKLLQIVLGRAPKVLRVVRNIVGILDHDRLAVL